MYKRQPYNRLYDLFYRAGVPLDSQRVASPFISPAIASLHLYKAIHPDTWGRMVGRVDGANFAALYGRTAEMCIRDSTINSSMKQKIILLCLCLVCTGLSTYAQWVVSDLSLIHI